MADLLCNVVDCIHRSKRKSKKWRMKNGVPLYGCTCEAIIINRVFDPDGDIEATAGKENMACCSNYEPMEKAEEPEDDEEWH